MSVRANREELIKKGILLPDPSIGPIQEGTSRHCLFASGGGV